MSQATASRIMLADNSAISTNPIWISFQECDLVGMREFGRDEGHRGTRKRSACRARVLSDVSGGSISLKASVTEVDWLLKRYLGTGSGTGGSPWQLAESLSLYYALVDKVAAKYLYPLSPSKLTIAGSEKQYLLWTAEAVGGAESAFVSSWPVSPTAPECGTAFMLADCALNYSGTAYPIQSFSLTIDNDIDPQQYENSITPTRFEAQDAIVQLSVKCAFRSDTLALYRAAVAGAAASLVITDGTTTYTFTFANLKIPNGGPKIPVKGRINFDLTAEAYQGGTGVAATDELIKVVKS